MLEIAICDMMVHFKTEFGIENKDGVSIIFYLQKIFLNEWNIFIERLNFKENEIWEQGNNKI